MLQMLQLTVNGLALGAAYALVALGFVLVLNAAGAVNFAQGDLVVAGGLLTVTLAAALPPALPPVLLLPVVAALGAVGGLAASLLAYLPLHGKPPLAVFISTMALGVILQNGTLLLLGPEPRAGPPLAGVGSIVVGGVAIARQSLAIMAAATAAIAGQQALFHLTALGRRLRASAQDPEMARACGIPVLRMILCTFALGASLAAVAGMLLSHQFFVAPSDGGGLMLKAYIAVTVGGWGSVPGAVVGALGLGLAETVLAAWVSQPVALTALYLGVLALLAWRPRGLWGEAVRRRV